MVIDNQAKMLVSRNLTYILSSLQEKDQPLVRKKNNYYLTKEGLQILNYFTRKEGINNLRMDKDDKLDPAKLEVWTEEELEKL